MTQPAIPPQCFGKEWDQAAPECSGGLDLDYTHPENGSHVRSQCRWFQMCGSRTQALKSAPIVPLQHVVRPPVFSTPAQVPVTQQQATQGLQQLAHSVAALSNAVTRPVLTPAQHMQQPSVSFMPVNFQMPSYLTAPEPFHPGEPLWKPLARELLRAALKAGGHTLANFMDRAIFGRHEIPKGV